MLLCSCYKNEVASKWSLAAGRLGEGEVSFVTSQKSYLRVFVHTVKGKKEEGRKIFLFLV